MLSEYKLKIADLCDIPIGDDKNQYALVETRIKTKKNTFRIRV